MFAVVKKYCSFLPSMLVHG